MNGIIFANVSASVAVLLVLLLRKLFKEKLFAKVFVMLWLLIIIRLLLPFEFYSPLSVFAPEKEPVFGEVNQPIFVGDLPDGKEYLSELEQNVSSEIPEEKTKISSERALAFIWALGGISVFGFFAAKHFYSVKRILKNSEPYDVPEIYKTGKTRFYKSKNLASPLSFGILRPTIVIPEGTEETELHFVLLHEQTHIKDRDAVLKALALFALSLNWFNPLVWFMVKIFERDIERYCDERVLKKIGAEKALFYANTILDFAERESLSLNYFSAASLYERVTSIMKTKHKKQNILVSALVLLAVILTITACGTLPEKEEKKPDETENLSEILDDMDKDTEEFIDYNGNTSSLNFVWPCSEMVITSETDKERNHNGIDIGRNYGSEIYASADGTVYIAGEFKPEYGLTVTIDHEQNFATLYANCSEIYVKKGDKVKAGELIARTGSTGSSSCCGLHFEIHKEKTDLDPKDVFLLQRKEETFQNNQETQKSAEEIAKEIGYMTLEEITAAGYYPDWMQPHTKIVYDENKVPKITEGGELLPEDLVGRPEFTVGEPMPFTSVGIEDPFFMIQPNTMAEYDLHGFIQNIYYLWPDGNYNLSPPPETVASEELVKVPEFLWPCEEKDLNAVVGSYNGHTGIDIGHTPGADIYASREGVVTEAEFGKTGYGYYLVISHGEGYSTLYAHCSEILVTTGQKVEAGDIIAKIGSTGNSTGNHLHFELHYNGGIIDPQYLLIKD